jgi:hypothetical protein
LFRRKASAAFDFPEALAGFADDLELAFGFALDADD